MYQKSYGAQEYRQQDVMGASPIRLVVMAYDVAITSCEKQDFSRAIQAVSILRDALNFDYPEPSLGLFRLYQWCLDCIRQGDYSAAETTLRELREAWSTIEKNIAPVNYQAAFAPAHSMVQSA